MSNRTGIEWTDATWNPQRGCSRVSRGCERCYAERQATRMAGPGGAYEGLLARGGQWNGQIRLVPELLNQPLRWKKPRRIFVDSMGDLFHENVPDDFIDQVFAVMALAQQHTFQVLTKRPRRMLAYMDCLLANEGRINRIDYFAQRFRGHYPGIEGIVWRIPNVWLGTSVEDQATADERIPLLLQTPAAVRWVSAEPLLGPVDLYRSNNAEWLAKVRRMIVRGEARPSLDWVVAGGESGPGARPMHPDWVRSLRDQCQAAGVPFLFKQWGEWAPTDAVPGGDLGGDMRRDLVRIVKPAGEPDGHFRKGDALMRRVGKKRAGRELDGRVWDQYPESAHV